jgi:phosphoribosylanthranilate isomerase
VAARLFVKICGVTCAADAERCVALGADAVGVNLVPSSRRRVSVSVARDVARALQGRAVTVAVVADLAVPELRGVVDATHADRLQLHGDEPTESVGALAPFAYKAVRIRDAQDVQRAAAYPGDWLLLDAFVPGELGGTGHRFDWGLARDLAAERPVVLAGGLTPDTVAEAVTLVRPYGVDVASGVEPPGQPGAKDWGRVAAFIAAARGAASG